MKRRNVAVLESVQGAAADGKSHYITKKLGELMRSRATGEVTCLAVSVNEDFTTTTFLQKLASVTKYVKLITMLPSLLFLVLYISLALSLSFSLPGDRK